MTKKSFNFSKAYGELEQIVQEFESREIDLEKDLPKFERGMELAQQLSKQLKTMENKVVDIERRFGDDEEMPA